MPADSEAPRDGGLVADTSPRFDKVEHDTKTASRITFVLLGIVAVTVAAHYIGVTAAYIHDRVALADALADIFHTWIPALSGFLGAALAYYFTQRRH